MWIVWELGEATAWKIQERLPGDRHYNSVMTIIRVLEKKGHLTHREEGRGYIYRPTVKPEKSRIRVLRELVKHLFGGSPQSLLLHLVESGDLTRKDIDAIRNKLSSHGVSKERKR